VLRITADVNGKPIGYLFVHNTGVEVNGDHLYNAAFWNPLTNDGVFGIEGIPHPRPEGWGALVFRVLRNVNVISWGSNEA
jgi:hypothetical protein